MKKLIRSGWCWRDEEKTVYVWIEEYKGFQNQETGELFKITERLNNDEAIVG